MVTLLISLCATVIYFALLFALGYMEEELNHLFNENHDF